MKAESDQRERAERESATLVEARRMELEAAREGLWCGMMTSPAHTAAAFRLTKEAHDREAAREKAEKFRERQSSGAWSTLLT